MHGVAALVAISLVTSAAFADVIFGANDVPTIFFISKSDDRNRVDYGIRLDASCLPASSSPMEVYWREFEGGRDGRVTHGLNLFEGPAYGVGTQRVTETRADGVTLRIEVRALPSRTIDVRTSRNARGLCTATAFTDIAGARATLDYVHLTLGDSPGSIRHADLFGHAASDGGTVTERITR